MFSASTLFQGLCTLLFIKGSICFRSLRSAPSVQVGTAPVCRKMSEFPSFSVRPPVSAGSLRTLLFDSGHQADALHRTRGVVGDKYQSLRPKTVIPPRRIECHHDFARLAGFDPLSAAKRTSDTFRSFYGPDYQGRFAVITKCQRSLCRSSCPFHGAKINNILFTCHFGAFSCSTRRGSSTAKPCRKMSVRVGRPSIQTVSNSFNVP